MIQSDRFQARLTNLHDSGKISHNSYQKLQSIFEDQTDFLDPLLSSILNEENPPPGNNEGIQAFWKNRGNLLTKMKKFPEAIVCYYRALIIDLDSPEAWHNMDLACQQIEKISPIFDKKPKISPSIFSKHPINSNQNSQNNKINQHYATEWSRWFAYILDFLLVLIIITIPAYFIYTAYPNSGVALLILGILVYWIYFAILEAGIHQATLGKRALKIYVTDNIGSKIRLSTSFLRSFLKLLLTITPFSILTLINGLSVSDSAQGKGLHDYLSNTLVLTNQTTKKPFIFGNIPSKRGLGYFLAIALVIIILIVISAVFGAIIFGMVGSQQTSQQISKTGDVATIAYTIYDDQNRPIVTTNSKIYNDTLNNGGTIFYSNPLMIPVNVATNTNVTRIPVQYQQYQTYFGLFKDEMGLISTGLSGMKMNDQKQISLVMTKDPLETTIDADQFAHLVKPVTETHVNEQIVLALTDQPQQVNLDNTASADQYMRTFYVKKINPEGLDMKYGYSTIDLQILSIKTK